MEHQMHGYMIYIFNNFWFGLKNVYTHAYNEELTLY